MYEYMTPEEDAQYAADFAWLAAYRADPLTFRKVLNWGLAKQDSEDIGRVRTSCNCPLSRCIRELYNIPDHVVVQIGLNEYDPNGDKSVYSLSFHIRGTGFQTMEVFKEAALNRFAHNIDNNYDTRDYWQQPMLSAAYIHNYSRNFV